ncbi:MAG: hypothetical protein WC263_02900 [Candidatus Micrarchaeia archaeon]
MRLLDERKPSGAASQWPETKAGRDGRSSSEKIGDLQGNPKIRILYYETALDEYERAAVSSTGGQDTVAAREKVLRVKKKMGDAHKSIGDALVKMAGKAHRSKARQLSDRAKEEYAEAGEMYSQCGDLAGKQQAEGSIRSLED